ncbi:MAG: endonuclease/exonuclease/phosphatase family protein [Microgenomates group bacterium]
MKIIFLNTWIQQIKEPQEKFIKDNLSDTDVFCFSEVGKNQFNNFTNILTDFNSLYCLDESLDNSISSQAIFVKKSFDVKIHKKELLYGAIEVAETKEVPGFVQGITLNGKEPFSIFNVQGMAYPGDKLDTPFRIDQSEKIINFTKGFIKPHLILGDFNLMPDTRSIGMLEKVGYRNLIKEFNIKTTRNKIAWEHFKNSKKDIYFGKQLFADYVFVSSEVNVKTFEVPGIEISDHLPLILNFDL